ncbi:MAG: ribosome maturation factor RimM [Prevotella sp.]|nr:ribosome maturation factor RimM [Prevotella sp.]
MIKREEVFKIGRLGKPHGVKGELFFHFDDDIFDRVECDYLVLEVEGILVPFFMESYRFRNGYLAFVKFKDVDTQQRASELTGCDVFFPRDLADAENEAPILELLEGFDLIDAKTNKVVGTITSINDQTANVLFELDNGALIPASDELIMNIDTKQEQIVMNIPDGLLEL